MTDRWWAIRARHAFWRRVVLASRKRLGGWRYARTVADMHFYLEGLWKR